MKYLLIVFSWLITLFLTGQTCDCKSNFGWVRTTFEENDAGFAYAIQIKGEEAYQAHNEDFELRLASVESSLECTRLLYEWLTFFRTGHVAIKRLGKQELSPMSEKDDIISSFKNWDRLEVDLKHFKQELRSKNIQDYEGIWETEPYEIGIKKVGNAYIGFIIKADGIYWTPGQVKLKINEDNSGVFYLKDHSLKTVDKISLLGSDYLEMGSFILERKYPKTKDDDQVKNYFESMAAEKPYFEKINKNTALLRIPTFSGHAKEDIDKVIKKNWSKILQTPHLIIDLRNNGGGSDVSFQRLLPIIYTNPVNVYGVAYLSTELNNQRMLDFINDPGYGFSESGKQWAQTSFDTLSRHLGEFVNLDTVVVDSYSFDTVYKYPEKIGVLINENNASTTEQFLLAARQSKKVTLYGVATMGVLDISNMYFVKSPCGDFELGYCLSKSLRPPEKRIDGMGIQPDHTIDQGIHDYQWVHYVLGLMNE